MDLISSRPEGSTWTDEQWAAIAARGQQMLVAAAAGSGKTAVLVERIIRRIMDEHDAIDVDRLLVATFTKAAAAEMRQRIRQALEEALFKEPSSAHLRRQLALVNRASITTLHSFCMEVIQRYYTQIGLDPGFRIANEHEIAIMRQELLEELLEERYSNEPEEAPFWRLVDWFGGDRGDEGVQKLVLRLYESSRSHPWPDRWLQSMVKPFYGQGQSAADAVGEHAASLEEWADQMDQLLEPYAMWLVSLQKDVEIELEGIISMLREACHLTNAPGGPAPYAEQLQADEAMVAALLHTAKGNSWSRLYAAFQTLAFGRLKACKGDEYDKSLQEQTKQLRDRCKEALLGLQQSLFGRSPTDYVIELQEMAPVMDVLVQTVIAFGGRYKQEKEKKRLLDFADLEHYCLQILLDDAESMQPSQAALDYQAQFVEVLLDEYQDTNQVQETILSLISKSKPGNRFMVGDVKQSIYRFRLADPGIFMAKYKAYDEKGLQEGLRIDLARNFRSRKGIVDSANFLFRQIMNEQVAEINYDQAAELVFGAPYEADSRPELAAELLLIDRSDSALAAGEEGSQQEEEFGSTEDGGRHANEALLLELQELETVQLEARLIAKEIKKRMGHSDEPPFLVSGKRGEPPRSLAYRDIVILLRATHTMAPILIEELKQQGIPAYAELNTGYFAATEVELMLSLLKIIDNPYQDIPLAGVLRSSIVGLSADQLAQIRLANKESRYFDALCQFAGQATFVQKEQEGHAAAFTNEAHEQPQNPVLIERVAQFLQQLNEWRTAARQGSLSDLIWQLYRDTGYYDFVGGMPGGAQRQANLRALHDRAKQYEATSFRGVFRFLRFIDRIQEQGGDLGAARALGEQEDVVRIMSIHKSKGLEFPMVFVAGLGKMFNQQDLNGSFLIHKELGFGPKYMDLNLRVSYPSLPLLAIKRKMRLELLAEEMRVLYVALTRPKEKLYLIGTLKNAEKQLQHWGRMLEHQALALPSFELIQARTMLDWIGPAIIRHRDAEPLRQRAKLPFHNYSWMAEECSHWRIALVHPGTLAAQSGETALREDYRESRLQSLRSQQPVSMPSSPFKAVLHERLSWQYPFINYASLASKMSVTEMKRMSDERMRQEEPEIPFLDVSRTADSADLEQTLQQQWNQALVQASEQWHNGQHGEQHEEQRNEQHDEQHVLARQEAAATLSDINSSDSAQWNIQAFRRPQFMEKKQVSATERGTVYHAVMQQLPMQKNLGEQEVTQTIERMVQNRLITQEQADVVDSRHIAEFFKHPVGLRMLRADELWREVAFTYGIAAQEMAEHFPGMDLAGMEDRIIVQGVIDCLFIEGDRLVLVDYKTDKLWGDPQEWAKRHGQQMQIYAQAVEKIWNRSIDERYLFFFDGAQLVELD